MEYFVNKNSIVRQIWGKSDTVLLIFAGAAAEFALNKAVDWLYFTGKLPADPLSRLFSTVSYARIIVFSKEKQALSAIDAMNTIHAHVEAKRGASIPEWAYRDVLFMLIDYSIRAFEILERKLSTEEKQEVLDVFSRVGNRMGVSGIPVTFNEWVKIREEHLKLNLQVGHYTNDLFVQYRKHLGLLRFRILLEAQSLICPSWVRKLLKFQRGSILIFMVPIYKILRSIRADWFLKKLLLPPGYKNEIRMLDNVPV